MNAASLLTYALAPLTARMRRWWYARREQHYLICAEVEERRAREHQQNVRYYQAKAAIARSERWQ